MQKMLTGSDLQQFENQAASCMLRKYLKVMSRGDKVPRQRPTKMDKQRQHTDRKQCALNQSTVPYSSDKRAFDSQRGKNIKMRALPNWPKLYGVHAVDVPVQTGCPSPPQAAGSAAPVGG